MSGDAAMAAGAHLFWPVERWRALQTERLRTHIPLALENPFYRNRAAAADISAGSSLELLAGFPLTTKDQLAAAGPDAWNIPHKSIAEWVSTSGTLGKPLDVPLTAEDLDRLGENEAVALGIAGVGRGDLFVLAVGMDRMFVAGLAYWLGARRLGATCIRVGPQLAGHPEMLADLLERMNPRGAARVFVIAVPSFLSAVAPPKIALSGIVGIGEPTRMESLQWNTIGERLHQHFGCPVMSTYATTETCTAFAEGPTCEGGHLNPALGVLEVVGENGAPAADGQVGEVVITPLGIAGMPLLRFRTGDMAAMFTSPCGCGRTTPRLGPILGRRQQMLKIRGTTVFPSSIIEALRAMPEVRDCVVAAEERGALSDEVMVYVAGTDESTAARGKIARRLQGMLRVTPVVEFVSEAVLRGMQTAGGRKLQRFIDRRCG